MSYAPDPKRHVKLRSWAEPLSFVVAASSLVLLMCSLLVDWDNLFVKGMSQTLNDQVGYVSVARNLADYGSLDNPLIIPSVLSQHTTKTTLYMPGHYWLLAATYRTLGFSVAHSFLPAILAYLASVGLLFVISRRLYGQTVGYYSCALFLFYPLNLIYAFTAMTEMPLVAAGLLAFAVFLFLPLWAQLAVGPLLVAIPLCFRETGALVAIPMAWMLFICKSGGWKAATAFVLLSAMVVALVLASPIGAGRPSLIRANVFLGGSFDAVYTDAFAAQKANASALNWGLAIARKFKENAHDLLSPRFSAGVPAVPEYFSLLFVLSGVPLGIFAWYKLRDDFGLAVALMVGGLCVLLLGVYTVWLYRGARLLLMTEPFVAALWGATAAQLLSVKKVPRRAIQALLLAFAACGLGAMYEVFKPELHLNQEGAKDAAFLESVMPDRRGVLVSPYWISLDYVARHYPVRWSHVPSNLETLKLLDKTYPISTIILPKSGRMIRKERLRADEILAIGFVEDREVSYQGTTFQIFKRNMDVAPRQPLSLN